MGLKAGELCAAFENAEAAPAYCMQGVQMNNPVRRTVRRHCRRSGNAAEQFADTKNEYLYTPHSSQASKMNIYTRRTVRQH